MLDIWQSPRIIERLDDKYRNLNKAKQILCHQAFPFLFGVGFNALGFWGINFFIYYLHQIFNVKFSKG